MRAVLKNRDRVQILTRRNVTQRERLADHGRLGCIQRGHVLNHLVAQATLEQRRGNRCRADRCKLVTGLRRQSHVVGTPRADVQLDR